MDNLRIISANVVNSTEIAITFNYPLDPNIDVGNITFEPQLTNVPTPQALIVNISGAILTLTSQPLTPLVPYFIVFASTPTVLFKSLNGNAILYQDGIANQTLIIAPIESDNSIQEFLINYLRDNIYNITDNTTLVNKLVQAFTNIYSKALYDIRQVKNENYLSFVVNDEQQSRGVGPFDRLQEEAAYEILRVGLTPTGTNSTFTLLVPLFDKSNISLLAKSSSDILSPSSKDTVGTFNINDLILTVVNKPVSKLTSLTFIYDNSNPPFVYDIETLGYQILNSIYDQDFASTYLVLNNNQFKLNSAILSNANFSTENILQVQISYEYRDLGRVVDPASVEVFTIMLSAREVIPPLLNIFSVKRAPITDQSGNLETSAGIIFIDPNGLTPTSLHPAFLYEIPFNFGAPPISPGQYSIDYGTGTVYVYGASTTQDGTGPTPPLATYYYEYMYSSLSDYAYDSDTNDIVALSTGNLFDNSGTISFNYEQVLVPGQDYNADVHIEVLDESIQNRLLALNILSTLNAPITNVFRIYNQTSGEIYNIVRWSNDKVYFSYTNPPNILAQTHERASFSDTLNELIVINSILINASSLNIFQCLLQNNNIIAATEDSIASSINSSAMFSDTTIFASELWYDINETQVSNINRLTSVGLYMIDYANGIVYVAVNDPTNIDIGTVSYKNDSIAPQFPHIISVDDIYYRISLLNPKDKSFTYRSFSDGSIIPEDFDVSDEALLNDFIGSAYQVFNNQVGAYVDATFEPLVSNNINFLRHIYEYNDLKL